MSWQPLTSRMNLWKSTAGNKLSERLRTFLFADNLSSHFDKAQTNCNYELVPFSPTEKKRLDSLGRALIKYAPLELEQFVIIITGGSFRLLCRVLVSCQTFNNGNYGPDPCLCIRGRRCSFLLCRLVQSVSKISPNNLVWS